MEPIKGTPVKDYAAQKNVTVQAVYQAIKRGTLKSRRIGSFILVEID